MVEQKYFDKYLIGWDPFISDKKGSSEVMRLKSHKSMIKVMEYLGLPNNVFCMVHPSGRIEKVTFEWDDINKKNNVIVKKIK